MLPRHIEAASATQAGGFAPNPDYLLFDDLVLRDVLAREHRTLFDVIRAVTGAANVHDLRDLLVGVLADTAVRRDILREVATQEALIGGCLSDTDHSWLQDVSPRQCALSLLTGARPDGTSLLKWPMPNLLFARDCLAVVGETVVVMRPKHPARSRDGVIARAIGRHAPLFSEASLLDVAPLGDSEATVEGGDVLVVSDRLVLVGVGIRTNAAGARALALGLAAQGVEVLAVRLPKKRAAMHLDTLFTFVDRDLSLAFMPVLSTSARTEGALEVFDPTTGTTIGYDLAAALAAHGHPTQLVACGDGERYAAIREQWTDGANAFCLAPGCIVLYGRNRKTLLALTRVGFDVTSPDEFIRNAELWLRDGRRRVVALDGFELSRGRGGPRCLTLPLRRGA